MSGIRSSPAVGVKRVCASGSQHTGRQAFPLFLKAEMVPRRADNVSVLPSHQMQTQSAICAVRVPTLPI